MLSRILTIVTNTFEKEIRRKSFVLIAVITALIVYIVQKATGMIVSQNGISSILDSSEAKLIQIISIISFFNGFLAILLAVDTVRSDFDTGMIQSILSRNISRWEYLIGRILGTWSIILFYYFFSFMLYAVYNGGFGIQMDTALRLLPALLLSMVTAFVWIIWGVFVSFYFPKMMSFLVVLFLMFAVAVSNTIFDNMAAAGNNIHDARNILHLVGLVVYYILPGTSSVNSMAKDIFQNQPFPPIHYTRLLQFFLTGSILTGVTFFLFQKRDVK